MNTTEWIEQFTGKKVSDGKGSGADPEALTRALEEEAAMKAMLLADAHKRVAPLKAEFQKAMSNEIKVRGSYFKQRMLDVKGTQIDEAEAEDIDISIMKLSPEVELVIKNGTNLIQMQGERLATATIDRPDKKGDILFKPVELEDGYWFPLTRERILPETYIGALYSKTQRMLDETNEAYLQAVADKREKGELTPKANRIRDLVSSGAELVTLGAEMTEAFGAGSEGAKLAVQILDGMVAVTEGAVEAYDKVKAGEYADGAKSVLGTMKILTSAILKAANVDSAIIKTTEKAFMAGGAAITAGKHFARGVDGAADGTNVLADVLQSVFEIAASETKNKETAKALSIVSVAAPTGMRAAAGSTKLVQALEKKDVAGVVDCLGSFATNTLTGVQGIRKITETEGQSKEKAEKTQEQLAKEKEEIEAYIKLGTEGLKTSAVVVLSIKRGQYQKAFDTLVDGVGNNLGAVLSKAGLPEDQAKKIGMLYKSASSGVKALECMLADEPDVPGALKALAEGIAPAFEAAAPGNKALQTAAQGLTQGFGGLADAATIIKLYKTGKAEEAVTLFISSVQSRLTATLKLAGVTPPPKVKAEKGDSEDEGGDKDSEEGDDEQGDKEDEDAEPVSELQKALVKLGESVDGAKELIEKTVDDALEEQVKKEARAQAEAEALAILEEAKADISEAEQLGRDAADIEKLIAKVQRDKMIMKIAVQVMQGGTAFLASFIPALGAASAAIKMMANMVAAAQRAEQLARWVNSQSDLAAAQSPLSSSAQNFVNNQAEQFAHYTIQAAFAAAELIGNVLETVGAATWGAGEAAGLALKIAAKTGSKLEEIIRKHRKVEEMEYAWKITQRALKNPSNRKLGLRARALNPTLAKYSIAWGAVKLKDPLARNALRACDLTEAVLENENANVDKVVEYLEAFYDEDDKMYREVEAAGPWIPNDISLTLRFWSRVKKLAVDNAKLANPDTGVLDGQLAQLRVDMAKLDRKGLGERVLLLQAIDRSFAGWVPQVKDAKAEEAMAGLIKVLRRQAANAITAAEKRSEELTKAEQKKSEQEYLARVAAMKQQTFVLGELVTMIASIESLSENDELADMYDTLAAGQDLVKDVKGLDAMKGERIVQSHLTMLESSLADLERLIGVAELADVSGE